MECSTFRVSLAKYFCSTQTWVTKVANSASLLKLALNHAAQGRLRGQKGNTTYEDVVTVLVDLRNGTGVSLPELQRPDIPGLFVSPHNNGSETHWIDRQDGQTDNDYFIWARTQALTVQGTLVYRSGGRNTIGVCATSAPLGAVPPRWFLAVTPSWWMTQDVEKWAAERGYLSVSGWERVRATAWKFRAKAPEGMPVGNYRFSSGITIEPARSNSDRKKQVPTGFEKSTSGMPINPKNKRATAAANATPPKPAKPAAAASGGAAPGPPPPTAPPTEGQKTKRWTRETRETPPTCP